jgi:predicted alpha/beta superfamily hydrolase
MTPTEVDRSPSKGTLSGVASRQLRNRRDIDVYLPSSYDGGSRRYPVVYMQDGQNLSDPAQAFAGNTWQLPDALRALAENGIEPIVVGVHTTEARLAEYSPFRDAKHGGGSADAYLKFLVTAVKPRVDRLFRTRRKASQTAIVGSSRGGLVSLYAWFARPEVFGLAAAMSPSLWFGRDMLHGYIKSARAPRAGRLYLDVGTAEGVGTLKDARLMRALLETKGVAPDERLRYLEDRGGRHEESAWARRIAGALEYLFA